MDVSSRALERIAEIHARMARAETFRGWRPVPVAASGAIALIAAALQPAAATPLAFTVYWCAVAVASMTIGCSEIAWQYVRQPEGYERRRTREVFEQFLPALIAGAIITIAFVRLGHALVPLLPGLWAVFFGVGIFAARPSLPRGCTLVALYYWTAGLVLLWNVPAGGVPSPWSVGLVFGPGQLLGALAIHLDHEKDQDRGR